MATTTGGVVLASQSSSQPFAPSIWGTFFLDHQPCTPSQLLSMKTRAHAGKEAVRQRILDAASSDSLIRKLELVDTLQRIGVGYHYEQEIDELLRQVYNDDVDKDGGSDVDGLYVTSLRFYLLRKHGYNVPSDVFLKFRDEQGNISSDDANCLITLYDAAHLRTHGEHVLDSAIVFNRSRLQLLLMRANLEPGLAEEVRLTLETPRFRRVKRVEARRYLAAYEKMPAARDDAILEFAKSDYNIVQALYCEELKELTMWWQVFRTQANTSSFARDRVVEMHFWMMEVFFEPQYSYSRKMLTQLFMIVSVIDDLYDNNYCTTEDGGVFAAALQRWDEAAAEQCPEYLTNLYKNILATVKTIEEELKLQGNKHAQLVKTLVIDIAKCYHAETEWRDKKYVPATVEEHLRISARSCGCMHVTGQGFISMGDDVATTEAIEWAFAYPKIIRAMCIIARIANDIMSDKREQASKDMASTVQACAREHGVTTEEAIQKLRELIEEAWMDIAEECLSQPQPAALLERVVNLARTMDFLYKDVDGYTESYSIKDTLNSIYVTPIC